MKTTHGLTKTREYRIWTQMRRRCRDPKAAGYQNYGGRGITVCVRWNLSFEDFLLDMGVCPPGCSIDRIDGDLGYQPGNCRWATHEEQNNNRKSNIVIDYDGRSLTVRQWSRVLGVSHTTLHSRLARGLTGADVLTFVKVDKRDKEMLTHNGETLSVSEWSARTGISIPTIRWRVKDGRSMEEILSTSNLPYPENRKSRTIGASL